MRVRYSRRPGPAADARDYEVRTQERPRARWVRRGLVSGFGARSSQWAALGTDAPAWTSYRATRAAAVADMLAGRTFQDAEETQLAEAEDRFWALAPAARASRDDNEGAKMAEEEPARPAGPARRTVRVTHTVDVPPGVTDEQVAGVFADMRVQYPALPGWWISVPQVAAARMLAEEIHEGAGS